MEEGFLGRLSRRRMAGPIYIIILLLSPGDAKIDDADVKQVVVELNQWKWVASMTEFKSIYFLTAGGHCFRRASKN